MKKFIISSFLLLSTMQLSFALEPQLNIKAYDSKTKKPGSVNLHTVRGGDPGKSGTEFRKVKLNSGYITLEVKNKYDECMIGIEISPFERFASYRLYNPHSDTGIEQPVVCLHLKSQKTTVFYGFDLLAKHLKIDLTENYDITTIDVRIANHYWSQNNSLILILEGTNPVDNKTLDLWFEVTLE